MGWATFSFPHRDNATGGVAEIIVIEIISLLRAAAPKDRASKKGVILCKGFCDR